MREDGVQRWGLFNAFQSYGFEIGFSDELGENCGSFGNTNILDEFWIGNH